MAISKTIGTEGPTYLSGFSDSKRGTPGKAVMAFEFRSPLVEKKGKTLLRIHILYRMRKSG